MSFVNEVVSESDVKAYGLDEVKRHWNEWAWRDGRPAGYVHHWVIDRTSQVCLFPVKQLEVAGPSGRPEPSGRSLWIFFWRGLRVKIVLERMKGSSVSLSDTPFKIGWNLSEIDADDLPDSEKKDLIRQLKEALQVYGESGALTQLHQTEVTFSF